MNLPLLPRGRLSAGLLAALGALATISALSVRTLNRLERDTQSRNVSNVTLLQLRELMRHLVDAETGQRGYLLSAEEEYLEPYDSALAEIDRDLGALRALGAEDPTLPLSLDRLQPLVDARLDLIDSIVRLQRAGRAEAARALVLTDSGKRIMDDVRVEVGRIAAQLEDVRGDRSSRVAAATRRTRWIMVAIGLLTAIVLAAAGVLSVRQATARSHAERQLAASKDHLSAILDALPVGVFVVDGSGRPYYANRVSRELLGKGLVDTGAVDLPQVYQAYVAGTERLYPGEQQPIVKALHGEVGHADDIEIRRPDRTVPIEVWAAPVHDRDGHLAFAVAAFSDITERRRMEEALREARQHLQAVLDHTSSIIYAKDLGGRYLLVNRRFREVTHRSAEEILGKTDHDLFGQTAGEVFRRGDARAAESASPVQSEDPLSLDDGIRTLFSVKFPMFDGKGSLYAVGGVATDITERKRNEERIAALNTELARRVEELEAVNKELETFSYSVSHDLRAPLRAIDGFSRMLVEDHGASLDAGARRLLGVIRDNAQRMGQLIDDLLQLSRLSRKELAVTPLDMTALVHTVVDDLRSARHAEPIEVVIGSLPAARGDPTLLRQVWANLVGNALKYCGSGRAPRVEIGGRTESDQVLYWVRDNGVGFDMRYADKLFGVFQRLHGREFEGTGVGLATVQRAVHRHGGRVWAEGEPDRGAIFFFTLPPGE